MISPKVKGFHLLQLLLSHRRRMSGFCFSNCKDWMFFLIIWFSRYLKKLLEMQEKYYELQTKHNRLKQILNLKTGKVKCLRREKSDIWKKYNELLKAHKKANTTKTSVWWRQNLNYYLIRFYFVLFSIHFHRKRPKKLLMDFKAAISFDIVHHLRNFPWLYTIIARKLIISLAKRLIIISLIHQL